MNGATRLIRLDAFNCTYYNYSHFQYHMHISRNYDVNFNTTQRSLLYPIVLRSPGDNYVTMTKIVTDLHVRA